jgi:hypothetical protein
MTGLMLEALVARVAATLELIFPGSEVELREDRHRGPYTEYEIILKTDHPRLSRDGRYYTCHRIPEDYLMMEGEAFVQHLITSLPSSHIRQITEIAIDTAHATRFKKTGRHNA